MARNKKGCIFSILGCVGVALIAGIVVGFFIVREAKKVGEGFKNPEPRTLEMLGIESMPEGYHANLAFKIPFIMDMVMMSNKPGTFTDEEHKQGKPFGDEGLIYLKFIQFKKDSGDLQDYFEGKSDNDRVLAENGVNINVDEVLDRGTFDIEGSQVYYLTQRGSINTNGARADGLNTLVLIPCSADKKMRLGIWYGPEKSASSSTEAAMAGSDSGSDSGGPDLSGTVGDLERIQAFFSQFQFCTK